MDPLSDILTFVGIASARCTRFEAGGAWALEFPAKPMLKFAAVLRGACWIALPGEPPRRLVAGDTFLLANAPSYRLASDLDLPPEDGFALFDQGRAREARHGGDDMLLIGGAFQLEAGAAERLLGDLPAFLLIPSSDPAAPILSRTLLTLDDELGFDRMGGPLVVQRLAEILLVQALRALAATQGGSTWIGALADRRIGGALRLMHADVAGTWTVAALARAVGMSRSSFAERFRSVVGTTPARYLAGWRMDLAREALRRGEVTVESLAERLGYGSESAFGHAFKRRFGEAPKRYGRAASRPPERPGSSSEERAAPGPASRDDARVA